ncbi:MAG: hypothetical protein ACTSVY_13490 [Candidatus Helarchaeota archaeon]
MPNITLSLPEDVYNIMKKHKEIRWSEIARRAIESFSRRLELLEEIEYEEKLALFDKLLQNSTLTNEDIEKMDHQLKKSVFKRIMEKSE